VAKKALWTLNVNDYDPEITSLTFPLMKKVAHKIGADFNIITDRKSPDFPIVYEKLQLYTLGKDYEWNIYLDADAAINPDIFDVTSVIPKNTVMFSGVDFYGNRFKYDNYCLRDGRHISACGWFMVASDWCLDLWHPLEDMTQEEALSNIFPIDTERAYGYKPEHFLEEYAISRNIARYGLKHTTFVDSQKKTNAQGQYFWHGYDITRELRIQGIRHALAKWGR
jgi:hypothetical protein